MLRLSGLINELEVNYTDAGSDGYDEFKDVTLSLAAPFTLLADFETYRLTHPGNDLAQVNDSNNLRERDFS
jgi:hypothetical protein